ncbi:MAG: BamA/TamA family outer membrane protein [Prevotella sp.]|nr:BamA/TamA family outer membrane protein [Prevotella sp.]
MIKQALIYKKSLFTKSFSAFIIILYGSITTYAQDCPTANMNVGASNDAASTTMETGYKAANDADTIKAKHGLVARLLQYFAESDKPKPDKKIDFGIIGGPHYATDTGFGIGLVASALYSTDRSDSTLEKSNASLYSDITSKAFLMIGIRGNNIFPKKRYRLDYRLYVYTFPSYLWGFNYPQSDNDDNKSKYSRTKFEVMTRFLIPINRHSYLGPIARYQYVHAYKLKDQAPQLLAGQPMTVSDVGLGMSYTFDSRDFMLNASKGWFVQLDLTANPAFLGNNNTYWSAELQLATYRKAWKGAIIAGELHTRQSAGDVPWPMLADVGSSNRMRGYYEGRYRDKNVIDAQLELRQHIWHRNGIVLWVGAAEVFPRYKDLRFSQILPNAGLGYRWQFKKGVNVRLDYGFSRNGTGFIFNINEAF